MGFDDYFKRRYSVMRDYSLVLTTDIYPLALVCAWALSKTDCELGVTLFDRKLNKYRFNTKED